MAFVVASDGWRRSYRPKPSTVSVSSSPSCTLAAALGQSEAKRRARSCGKRFQDRRIVGVRSYAAVCLGCTDSAIRGPTAISARRRS